MNAREKRIWQSLTPEMQETVREMVRIDRSLVDLSFSNDKNKRRQEIYAKQLAPWQTGGPKAKKTAEIILDGPYGELPLRLYLPQQTLSSEVIFYIHGGGYIVGDFSTHDRVMRELMEVTGLAVVGIDYHLAPEISHPAPIDECEYALKEASHWLGRWQLPIDAPFILAGDSCGATIALALALRLRANQDALFDRLFAMLLYYGGFGLNDSFSMRYWGGPWDGMDRKALASWRDSYMGGADPEKVSEWDHFKADYDQPLLPAFIAVSNVDPLYDDSVLLYRLMKEQNITVFHEENGVLHGYLQYSQRLHEAEHTQKAAAAFINRLKKSQQEV